MWKFELKKVWRRKQFLLLLIAVVISVASIYLWSYWSQDEIVERNIESMALHSSSVFQVIDTYSNEMIIRSENSTLDEAFIAEYENVNLMSQLFNQWMGAVRDKSWGNVPRNEYAFIQAVIQHMEFGGTYFGYFDDQLKQSLERNQILIENDLPYEDERYSIAAPNFMKVVFSYLLSTPVIGFLIILLGDTLVREKETYTIRTLSTQPLARSRLLFGKFMSKLSVIFFVLLIIIIACFLFPFLFGGHSGSFSYPQLVYTDDGFKFIPVGEYLILYVLLFLGAASFLFSVTFLFSVLLNDRLTVIFFSLLALFGGVSLTSQFTVLQSIVNPFYYFQFQQLIVDRELLSHPLLITIPYAISIITVMISVPLLKHRIGKNKGEKNNIPFKNGAVSIEKGYFSIISILEWRKYKREGIVKRFSIIILFLIIAGYIIISLQTDQLRNQHISRLNESLLAYQNLIVMNEQMIKENEEVIQELERNESSLTDSEKDVLEQSKILLESQNGSIRTYSNRIEQRTRELEAFQQEDWKTVYEYWNEELMLWWKDPQYDDNTSTKRIGGGRSDFTYLASVEEKKWLSEHQLEPAFINEYTPYTWTIYDEYISPMDQLQWNQDTRKVSDTGLFYVYTFFTTPSYLVLYVLLIFILGAGLAAEKSDRRTIALLQTQPLNKQYIYIGKTSISMLLTGIIASLSVFSMVLIGTIVNRFGDWKFPIVHYDPPSLVDAEGYTGFVAEEGGFHFMYMGRYLLETGTLFLAGVLFLLAFSLLFSLFFKNTMTVFVTTVIVAAGGYVLSNLEVFSGFAQWVPFTYLDIGKIANGQMAAVLGNEEITTVTGIVALIIGIIIFLVGGILISGRKKGGI